MLLLFPRGDRPDVTTLRATVTGTERIAVTNTLGEEDPRCHKALSCCVTG